MSSYDTGETTMRWRDTLARRGSMVALLILTSGLIATHPAFAQAQTGPRATGVRSEVSGNTITVFYDLVGATSPTATFTVTLQASLDGGQTFTVRPVSVTGDVGPNVRAGTGKRIVWDATKDVQILQLNRFSFSVVVAPARAGTSTAAPTQPAASTPASAPGEVMVRAGFSLLSETDSTTGKGVIADFSKALIPAGKGQVGVVGEMAFYKRDTIKVLMFGGGARYTFDLANGKLRPYGSFTGGAARFSDFDFSETKPYIAPGVGVIIGLSDTINVFTQLDSAMLRFDGEWIKDVRFAIGLAWSLGR